MTDLPKKRKRDSTPEWMIGLGGISSGLGALALDRGAVNRLSNFANIDTQTYTDDQAAGFLKQYAEKGGPVMHDSVLGIPATSVVRLARSIPGAKYKWDPSMMDHYREFMKGTEPGMVRRLQEIFPDTFGKTNSVSQYTKPQIAEAGRRTVDAYKGYKFIADSVLGGRNLALYGGMTVAGLGAGMLLYRLLKKSLRSNPTSVGYHTTA